MATTTQAPSAGAMRAAGTINSQLLKNSRFKIGEIFAAEIIDRTTGAPELANALQELIELASILSKDPDNFPSFVRARNALAKYNN